MARLIITVSGKMDKVLREESVRRVTPVAALVREAVEEWAEKRGLDVEDNISWGGPRPQKNKEEDPTGQLAGVGAS